MACTKWVIMISVSSLFPLPPLSPTHPPALFHITLCMHQKELARAANKNVPWSPKAQRGVGPFNVKWSCWLRPAQARSSTQPHDFESTFDVSTAISCCLHPSPGAEPPSSWPACGGQPMVTGRKLSPMAAVFSTIFVHPAHRPGLASSGQWLQCMLSARGPSRMRTARALL
jgi:hypothetical protein